MCLYMFSLIFLLSIFTSSYRRRYKLLVFGFLTALIIAIWCLFFPQGLLMLRISVEYALFRGRHLDTRPQRPLIDWLLYLLMIPVSCELVALDRPWLYEQTLLHYLVVILRSSTHEKMLHRIEQHIMHLSYRTQTVHVFLARTEQ
jgi:hypothetical protein